MPRTKRSPPRSAVAMTAIAALALGCGGGADGGPTVPTGPAERVFSSLSMSPTSATICTVTPANAVVITATARDQNNQTMSVAGSPSFTSSNEGTAAVDANGLVTGLVPGTAQIRASLTVNGTSRTAEAAITVVSAITGDVNGSVATNHPLPHVAGLTAVQLTVGAALTLDIRGQALHSHSLSLAGSQIMEIAGGCTISQFSSQDPHSDGSGAHTHLVTFN